LADFFAFFAFFAFLAMLPSVIPKLAQCKPIFDMHTFKLHHNCKIDTACFEEGKRPPSSRLAPPDEALVCGGQRHVDLGFEFVLRDSG
jgi:hypothetical protein